MPYKRIVSLSFLIIFILSFPKTEGKNCSRISIRKEHYTNILRSFREIQDNLDTVKTFFTNNIATTASNGYTHNIDSCLFLVQEYQIKAIDRMYQKLLSNYDTLRVEDVVLVYSEYLVKLAKCITIGPFFGSTSDEQTVNEIKSISKAEMLYKKALNQLKGIRDWQSKPICDMVITISIEKCLLLMKVDEVFRRNYRNATKDCYGCEPYGVNYNFDDEAISQLEKVRAEFGDVACFSASKAAKVDSLIQSIKDKGNY